MVDETRRSARKVTAEQIEVLILIWLIALGNCFLLSETLIESALPATLYLVLGSFFLLMTSLLFGWSIWPAILPAVSAALIWWPAAARQEQVVSRTTILLALAAACALAMADFWPMLRRAGKTLSDKLPARLPSLPEAYTVQTEGLRAEAARFLHHPALARCREQGGNGIAAAWTIMIGWAMHLLPLPDENLGMVRRPRRRRVAGRDES